ncbi:hypothetical protein NSU06_03455 [Staphylococcus sp. FSL W8-1270]|uniref:hypothetical protein n=1 Tax=Staphylococcus sp. FSL W8-1270 TaxID=2954652 RepID=UPI0030F4CAAE
MAEVKLSIEEYHNVVKSLYTLIEKLYEMTKKCNDYKKQRDELISDMAEVKRKAEAFDEIKELVSWFEENDRYEFEGQVGKIIKIIKDLECGSDE